MLKRLHAVNESAISAQKKCKNIAVKADLATSSRLEQMEAVLRNQEEAESKMNDDDGDDEKDSEFKSSDIKLTVIYDEKAFASSLDTVFNVRFNDDELDLKYDGMPGSVEVLSFSTTYKSTSQITLSDDNRCATKTQNGHRYILADSEPVSSGIHCWRIKVEY